MRHYPGKSLNANVRQLRLKLLPVLAEVIGAGKHGPRYTRVENEDFYFKSLSGDRLERLQVMWKELETDLLRLLLTLPEDDRSNVFLLVARAKSLLEAKPSHVRCSRSIADCVRPFADHAVLPRPLRLKLTEFSNAAMPKGDSDYLSLKSYIRSFTDVPSRGGNGFQLRAETINLMDETCPEVMRTLPGYRPPSQKHGSPFLSLVGPRSNYGKEIHALIDKTVFERFVFIRMA